MANGSITTTDLCRQWVEAENVLDAVQRQTASIKANVIDQLCQREPERSNAFLCAVVKGENPKPKDYFTEEKKA